MLYVGLGIHSRHISMCSSRDTSVRAPHSGMTIAQMMRILERLPDRFKVKPRWLRFGFRQQPILRSAACPPATYGAGRCGKRDRSKRLSK